MKRRNKLTLSIVLLIIMTDINESVAQTLMKWGLNKIGMTDITISNLCEFLSHALTNTYVWLGVGIFLINFFLWLTILSRVDLSIAAPIGSTSYIFVPLLSMIFLHETINLTRWLGIILIVAGIHFVAKSAKTETMPL